jgi:hypothetical protein
VMKKKAVVMVVMKSRMMENVMSSS